MPEPLRYVFLGDKDRGCRCLEAMVASGRDVAGVVALPDRGRDTAFASVAATARGLGIDVIQPCDINAEATVRSLRDLAPDVMVLVGYPQLIRKAVRAVPRLGSINLHASPLPRYRGAAPLNWMLIHGETEGGISILEVDAGVDTGDILAQRHFPIGPDDDYAKLVALTLELYPPLLLETLDAIEQGRVLRTKQDPCEGSFFTRRKPDDGAVAWATASAEQVRNLVRALVRPAPGAFTLFEGRRIGIERARHCDRTYLGVPGRVAAHRRDAVVVICADRGLEITHVRTEHGEVVPARDVLPPAGSDLGR